MTGLVVNDHVAGRPDFRDHVLGLVSWVAATGTPRARAIAAEARLVDWGPDPD